jgi:hypothetical protein
VKKEKKILGDKKKELKNKKEACPSEPLKHELISQT